jgi:hypothetical protein
VRLLRWCDDALNCSRNWPLGRWELRWGYAMRESQRMGGCICASRGQRALPAVLADRRLPFLTGNRDAHHLIALSLSLSLTHTHHSASSELPHPHSPSPRGACDPQLRRGGDAVLRRRGCERPAAPARRMLRRGRARRRQPRRLHQPVRPSLLLPSSVKEVTRRAERGESGAPRRSQPKLQGRHRHQKNNSLLERASCLPGPAGWWTEARWRRRWAWRRCA